MDDRSLKKSNEAIRKKQVKQRTAGEKELMRAQLLAQGVIICIVIGLFAVAVVYRTKYAIAIESYAQDDSIDNNLYGTDSGMFTNDEPTEATAEAGTLATSTEAATIATITATPTEEPKINTTIKLSFIGDCMLATYGGEDYEGSLNWYADNYPTTYFFDEVRTIFEADDFTIANCENVFTDEDLPQREKPWKRVFWFRSKKKNARIFADNSIEAVTIANNHLYDYSDEGAEDTREALNEAGVLWGEDENIIYLEKDGYRLAVICISTCGMKGGGGNLEEARSKLQYLKEAQEHSDFQIVYYHGGTEKSYKIEDWCVEMAKEYIDEGADLILGAHPHVLQPLGEYNGVDIAYSLGNFCYGGHNAPKNRTIIYQYTIEVVDDEVASKTYNIIPCYVYTRSTNNWQPDIIEDEDQINRVLLFMKAERSDPD